MKPVHLINLSLLLALIGFAAVTYADLPEAIPVHFGADGRPTRWASPSLFSWFGLPFLCVLLVAFMYGMAWLVPGNPNLINIPNKNRFLALPAERRAPVIERVQHFMYCATVPTILVMGLVQWSMYRGAVRGSTGADILLILVTATLVGPALMIFWSRYVEPELTRQLWEHGAEG